MAMGALVAKDEALIPEYAGTVAASAFVARAIRNGRRWCAEAEQHSEAQQATGNKSARIGLPVPSRPDETGADASRHPMT